MSGSNSSALPGGLAKLSHLWFMYRLVMWHQPRSGRTAIKFRTHTCAVFILSFYIRMRDIPTLSIQARSQHIMLGARDVSGGVLCESTTVCHGFILPTVGLMLSVNRIYSAKQSCSIGPNINTQSSRYAPLNAISIVLAYITKQV